MVATVAVLPPAVVAPVARPVRRGRGADAGTAGGAALGEDFTRLAGMLSGTKESSESYRGVAIASAQAPAG